MSKIRHTYAGTTDKRGFQYLLGCHRDVLKVVCHRNVIYGLIDSP